jgi:hypothetical protein
MKRTLLILICGALLFGACGARDADPKDNDAGGAPSANPEDPVTSAPQSPGDGTIPSPEPSIVMPQPGQDDVRPIGWDSADKGKDDQTLTINYISGVEPCYVLDHIDVEYSAKKITITLFEGHTPGEEDTPCIELAVYKATVLKVDEPIDGRKIVDGAPK